MNRADFSRAQTEGPPPVLFASIDLFLSLAPFVSPVVFSFCARPADPAAPARRIRYHEFEVPRSFLPDNHFKEGRSRARRLSRGVDPAKTNYRRVTRTLIYDPPNPPPPFIVPCPLTGENSFGGSRIRGDTHRERNPFFTWVDQSSERSSSLWEGLLLPPIPVFFATTLWWIRLIPREYQWDFILVLGCVWRRLLQSSLRRQALEL